MTLNQHILNGCSPAPLAHYLKALGILRLVSEQRDPNCRGAWRDDHFVFATTLSKEELEGFFLEEYEPTAFVSPWNKGSGFYMNKDPGLYPIESSKAQRLTRFREGIAASRLLFTDLAAADANVRAIKDEPKKLMTHARESYKRSDDYKARLAAAERRFKSLKANFIPQCRLSWRGSHLDWMNAAMVLDDDGQPSYPALLGTGGNDGRLDFTNNLMQRLAELFDVSGEVLMPTPQSRERLAQALWKTTATGVSTAASVGQYLPGAAGGANSTTGPDGGPQLNPWDFVLMLEGAILFAPAATKRLGPSAQTQASAPFALRSNAAGGGTFDAGEESARGEQWLPLWERYASLSEIKKLLDEGRAQVGRSSVARPIDMARAISRLGVARGISSFQRYGYLERNGQSNFAVPLGRIPVGHAPLSRLVDDLVSWMNRLMRAAREAVPARLAQAERHLSDAVFAALTHDQNPTLWQGILVAAARVEAIQASGIAVRVGPIPRLSPEWVFACDDGSAEFRLAVALGSAHAPYSSDGKSGGSVRHHWLPLKQWCHAYAASEDRLSRDLRVVATSREPMTDLIAVLRRRHLESQQSDRRHPQLLSVEGARLSDLAAWVSGTVDAERCVDLARAFMAVNRVRWNTVGHQLSLPRIVAQPDDAGAMLRLCCLSFAIDSERDVPLDPEILRRLESGNLVEAFRIASQRLRAHGIHPTLRHVIADPNRARRWASALAFPISHTTAKRLLSIVQPAVSKENQHVRQS